MYTAKKASRDAGEIDLVKEYSPSKNSKRFLDIAEPDKAVIEQFLRITTQQTQMARTKYRVRQNVSYVKNFDSNAMDNQVVDIYFKDKEHGTPIFVYIHGGFWQELDRNTSASFVEPLVERGYRVIVVDYNLCPSVTLQTLTEQIADCYEWIFKYAADTQASKISFSGHSAGAHLSTLLFSKKLLSFPNADRLVSVFLISGVFDIRECWALPCVNPKNIWNMDVNSVETLSPICWELNSEFIEFAKKINLRIYIIVAENDSESFRGQSRAFAGKLVELGLQIDFKMIRGCDHFDIIEEVPVKGSLINSYLLKKMV